MIGHFKTAFTQKYATFHGRASRAEYWSFLFIYWVILIGLAVLGSAVASGGGQVGGVTLILPFGWMVAGFLPGLGVTVRRFHDTGKSGVWYLGMFVPLLNFVWSFVVLVLLVIEGDPDPNRYGPPPGKTDASARRSSGSDVPPPPPPPPPASPPPPQAVPAHAVPPPLVAPGHQVAVQQPGSVHQPGTDYQGRPFAQSWQVEEEHELRLRFADGRAIAVTSTLIIGRDPVVPDTHIGATLVPVADLTMTISKTHAAIGAHDGKVWVEDLHSSNGVVVAGATGSRLIPPGTRTFVSPGDRLVVGDVELAIETT